MNKRHGMEGALGLGGGAVNEVSRKNLEIAEDLCRKKKPKEALPYIEKALDADASNLDAFVQLAFLMPTLDEGINMLKMAEAQGKKWLKQNLAKDCFDDSGDHCGHFWSLIETRPYMRVLQAIVRLNVEAKHYNEAAETIVEMLRLCPGDNLGQRSWMGSVLQQAGRHKDALHFSQRWLEKKTRYDGTTPKKAGCDFETEPSKTPLPQAEIDDMSEWTPACHVYTAALAAFRLWGDCELARQYYKLAIKLNPNVMIKVLAKVVQPTSLNNLPRSQNGPEEAHDYLWLTQDLWMAEDVWNWANSQPKTTMLRNCSRRGCNKTETNVAAFKRCAACHEVWYCGPQCQKADWANHKPVCQEAKRMKDMMKSFSRGR